MEQWIAAFVFKKDTTPCNNVTDDYFLKPFTIKRVLFNSCN